MINWAKDRPLVGTFGESILQFEIKIAGIALLLLALGHNAEAQTGPWSTQGPSNCSDANGSFDAFIPGMRGHGSCNRGGFVPGTTVIRVTNTNATGPGSLEAAIKAACPKVILFDVAGLINRGGSFIMNDCDNWSIVGASAPGAGITITGATDRPLVLTNGSDWTIDHMTIAAGDNSIQPGGLGNRDSIAFGDGGGPPEGNGIVFNNNLIWGADETLQCYPQWANRQSNLLFWQNVIGLHVGGAGIHIIQNSCPFNASIRNFYVHSHERVPLVRADGYFHANNFAANIAYRGPQIEACAGGYSPIDNQIRMNFIDNFIVQGSNLIGNGQRYLENPSGSGCADLQVYEDGNQVMRGDQTILNCANHACTGGYDSFASSVWESNPITAAYPTGYVSEKITSSQAGLLAYASQITGFAGARPTNRLSYIQTQIAESINMVDGSGPIGGWNTGGVNSVDHNVADEGGISVITPASSSWNPTAQCGGMPTGATADAIQSSGLTRLHEWVIGCFYDNVMPGGYREDGLQNYPAPGGGGSGPPPPPPPPRPNPPEWGVG